MRSGITTGKATRCLEAHNRGCTEARRRGWEGVGRKVGLGALGEHPEISPSSSFHVWLSRYPRRIISMEMQWSRCSASAGRFRDGNRSCSARAGEVWAGDGAAVLQELASEDAGVATPSCRPSLHVLSSPGTLLAPPQS